MEIAFILNKWVYKHLHTGMYHWQKWKHSLIGLFRASIVVKQNHFCLLNVHNIMEKDEYYYFILLIGTIKSDVKCNCLFLDKLKAYCKLYLNHNWFNIHAGFLKKFENRICMLLVYATGDWGSNKKDLLFVRNKLESYYNLPCSFFDYR